MIKTLACFVEGPSEQAVLEGVFCRLLPVFVQPRFVVFSGKADMEKRLEHRLRGWQVPNTVFLLLRDQDAADCLEVKRRLVAICHAAGKPCAVVRIACHELESFFFGDLCAVEKGLGLEGLAHFSKAKEYRNPDQIAKPSDALKLITEGKYQKRIGSREIGKHLSLENNTSQSFMTLLAGIRKLLQIV
jgi:hypothetical protein